jgi:hypothetical protein
LRPPPGDDSFSFRPPRRYVEAAGVLHWPAGLMPYSELAVDSPSTLPDDRAASTRALAAGPALLTAYLDIGRARLDRPAWCRIRPGPDDRDRGVDLGDDGPAA